MVAHEPAHLVGVVKACPRPGCLSPHVKWCYYNNRNQSQPRYKCLGCKKHFTFGGKIRQSKDKMQPGLRQEHAGASAVKAKEKKKKGPRIKITRAESSAESSNHRAVKGLQVMESRPKSYKISSPNDLSVQPASRISKSKRMRGGSCLLPLTSSNGSSPPDRSSDETYEVDAGADTISSAEIKEIFDGFEEAFCELDESFGGFELVAFKPELELIHDVGLGSGADAPDDQLQAPENGGPAFSRTSSEYLRGPIVGSIGSSEPALQDSEKELLLIDTGLSSVRSWENVYM